MDYKTTLGLLSSLAAVVQYIPYVRDVLRHKTKPHAFSWFVWGVPCGIVFVAQLMGGGGAGSWATAATTVLCTLIFLLSLSYGEKNITRLDTASLLLAMIALALWAVTDDPLWSVILVTAADCLGCVPTLRKSITKPFEETISTYVIGSIKWMLALPAIQIFSVTTCLYPAAMATANAVIVVTLLILRKRVSKNI